MLARPAIPLALLAVLAGALVLVQTAFSASSPPRAPEVPSGVASTAWLQPAVQPRRAKPRRALHQVGVIDGTVGLRARPGGPVDARLGPRTEFGSARTVAVAARRGRWLGVVTTARPNGRLAWLDRREPALRLKRVAWSLHADLSERRLELRHGGRSVRSLSVATGAPGSPTPTGHFAVTDKLSGGDFGPYYGCCVLALSGHQPNTPPGWTGGNRLAIHGTDTPGTIGAAASAGCLRARDRDLAVLMRRVPLGTPVFVRR